MQDLWLSPLQMQLAESGWLPADYATEDPYLATAAGQIEWHTPSARRVDL